MAKINLREFYPFYDSDCFIEVPDNVIEELEKAKRKENAYRRRMYRNRAHYSLDCGDGIEQDVLFVSMSPSEIYELKLSKKQLYAAIAALPSKQGKRIYSHYILGMSKTDIALAEGVNESAVRDAIERGLFNLEIFLKNF